MSDTIYQSKSKLRKKQPPGTHMHRIIPGHMGGEYTEDNVIFVTPERHRELHQELFEKYGHPGDAWAVNRLGGSMTGQKHTEEAKQKIGEASKRLVRTETHRKRQSESLKGRTIHWADKIAKANTGKTASEETRKKISESNTGNKYTEEVKKRMSENIQSRPKLTCPHCGKEGQYAAMKRWHYDNCRNLG